MKFKIGDLVQRNALEVKLSQIDTDTPYEVKGVHVIQAEYDKIFVNGVWHLADYFVPYTPDINLEREQQQYLIEIMKNVVAQLDKVDITVPRLLRNAINEGRDLIVGLGVILENNTDPIEEFY